MSTFAEREKRRGVEHGSRMNKPLLVAVVVAAIIVNRVDSALDALSEHTWELERAGVLWGEPMMGLRAGIESVAPASPPADHDPRIIRLHLRNEGPKPVHVVRLGALLYMTGFQALEVRRDGELLRRIWKIESSNPPNPGLFRTLEPGGTVTADGPLSLHGWGLRKDYVVDVRFIYERRKATAKTFNRADEPVTVTGLWTGRVESKPITVTRGLPGWKGRFLRLGVMLFFFSLLFLASRATRRWYEKTSDAPGDEAETTAAPPSSPG